MPTPKNFHDIPDPHSSVAGNRQPNTSGSKLSLENQARKYKPPGVMGEPDVATLARVANHLVDRATGKAYSADELQSASLDRANHTGTQAYTTITGLGSAATAAATDFATGATAEVFSSTVKALVVAHRTANANASPAALLGWARCLGELETGGILDELTDGACLRQGFNSPTAYKSIRNVAATIRGTVPQGPFGAIFNAATANTLDFAVADARVSTFAADFRYGENTVDYACIGGLYNTGGTNIAARSLLVNPLNGEVVAASVYLSDPAQTPAATFTSAIGDESDAFMVGRYNPLETMAAYSSDNAVSPTLKVWVNGKLVLTDNAGNYQQTSALTQVILGAQFAGSGVYQFPLSGTVASWLLFNRVLTDAENIVVAKALRALDLRTENLVLLGDSRTTQIASSTNQTGNWPYQYWKSPVICRRARLCNIARNGVTALWIRDNLAARGSHLGVNGTSVKTANAIVWSGANDWLANYTAVQVWGYLQTIVQSLRTMGMTATICTDPEADDGYTEPQETERLAFNVLVRAGGYAADAVWDIDLFLKAPRTAAAWLNDYHLNALGNTWLAQNLLMGGLQGLNTP